MPRPKGPKIPVPTDFAEVAPTMLRTQLRRRYGVSNDVVTRWVKETGTMTAGRLAQKRSVPGDFATLAPTMSLTSLQNHYSAGERTVKRWLRESGAKAALYKSVLPQRLGAPTPHFCRAVAPTMTHPSLRAHYGVGAATVARWVREAGVPTLGILHPSPPPIPGGMVFRGHAAGLVLRDLRQRSMYDDAADTLRRERFVVFRCDGRGRADLKGTYWRIGNTLLTPDELLQRAEKYRKRERDLQVGVADGRNAASATI